MSSYEESEQEVQNFLNPKHRVTDAERIDALSKRIHEVETEIAALKNFINQMIETGPINDREMQGWEVSNVIANWAKRDQPH